ncbi:MAG TPA: PQQ-binding-like beta-propeller repeat protein, partial [Gemmatimonadaceae bacterium]|nr:PQQ-binding-like beta-propeller repeat protein [Gemmatimonadaceae bacterium]
MMLLRSVIISLSAWFPVSLAAQSGMFRGGAEHRGEYTGPGVPAFAGLQWRVQTLGPIRGSPTAVGQTVYVGSSDGSVYAIDLPSGEVKWRRNVESPVMSTPAVDNGLVLVGSYDGTMRALRAASGDVAWTFRTQQPVALRWGFESGETWTSSATIAGGAAVFGARDGNVYAVNATSGTQKWRYSTGTRVVSSPAIANGV